MQQTDDEEILRALVRASALKLLSSPTAAVNLVPLWRHN